MNIQIECFDTKSTMNFGNYLSNTAMELVLVCLFVCGIAVRMIGICELDWTKQFQTPWR